jgi:acetoin utilization deacetylase AcuC-like enzyme/formylglycine-generating enzyme required for sulfatase activity
MGATWSEVGSQKSEARGQIICPLSSVLCLLFSVFSLLSSVFCPLVFFGCRRAEDTVSKPEVIITKTGIEMVAIPAGWFEMGNDKGASDESPVHRVWVSSFWMDRFEVVQEQFKKFQLSDPSHFKNPKNPLEQINWTDAAIYCNERSLAEGLEPCYDEKSWQCNFEANGYRLPTEAQWEYACRAGTDTKYSFGNDARKLKAYAWFAESSSGKTHPVGSKSPNQWGFFDMHGNVAEWCNDFYSGDYYKQSPQKDPKGPPEGKERVLRGGAWNSSADSCRSTYRASDPSINDTCLASDAIGFRCVRGTPSPPETRHKTQDTSGLGSGVWGLESGGRGSAEGGFDPNPALLGPNTPHDTSAEQDMAKHNQPVETSKTGFLYDDIYLEHKTIEGHPERPQRLTAIIERLKANGLHSRLFPLVASPAALEWLTTVHTPEYVERARKSCEDGIRYLDSMDNPISPRSYEAALAAVGGVLSAIDAVMEKKVRNAFCAIRPPGHHALKDRAMGFCIFNNVAVGTRYIQKKYNLSKILIVDWDVHHGNGTAATFYDDPNVLYFSVHQYPFYPGTGSESEKGSGKGLNYNINVPLPAGSTDADYVRVFEEKLKPAAISFCPDFVLISAGFDAHKDDPLGGMQVTEQGFAQLTEIVKEIAQKCCEGRLVSVLEGGYSLEGLAASVEAHIRVLMRLVSAEDRAVAG